MGVSQEERGGMEAKFGMDGNSPLVFQPKGWDPADEEHQAPRNVYSPVRNCRCPKHEL